jgi:DNA-binding LacI/PurR family transcriptional regulator
MDARIVVMSAALSGKFEGLMYAHIKKHLRPGETTTECVVPPQGGVELARARMLAALQADPRPVAMIGICYRPDPETIEDYRAAGVPVVLIDEQAEGASTVGFDSFAGGYIAGQYLARSGRKAIAMVSGDTQVNGGYNAVQRVNGFAKALVEAGLPFRREDVIEVRDYTRRDGVNAMARILDEKRQVDAVFSAAGDGTATGILATARERGVKVPEQLAVLGYDDSPIAAISDPPLSTIRQSTEAIAESAIRLATEDVAEVLARPKKLLLEPTLVLRRSA